MYTSYVLVGFWAANVVATVSEVCFAGRVLAGTFVQPDASEKLATWYESPKVAAPAASSGIDGAVRTPRVEKKFVKSTVGPLIPAARPPTHSTCATFLPARSAALAMVSAWRTPAPENDVRLENRSPVRWNVLLVEPCSPGYVPVARVYQPTPVFGGNPCSRPFAPSTPFAMRSAYVGMAPSPM